MLDVLHPVDTVVLADSASSTRAMRPSIKKAKNVAAWMVLEEIRAERAQNKRKAVS